MKKQTLWNKNFTRLIVATTLGSVGGIIGSYAMQFLVFDETGSTLATAVLSIIQILPHFIIPLLIAPIMDRFRRKPFLVGGDIAGGILYGLAGLYLHYLPFSYGTYLLFSLVINCINAFDELAYNCIFPKSIPEGFEEKGYTISAMLYPVLNVVMMPLAAVLMDFIGVANILLIQGGLSILAAFTENGMQIKESLSDQGGMDGIRQWIRDFIDGFVYLKGEKGMRHIYTYGAVANGISAGCSPILVAFFRTTPGFSAKMYAFFSGAEFVGRSIGGVFRYKTELKKEKKQGFVYFVQQFYNIMDAILLWLPYPLMLLNRGACGFLGINSASVRQGCVQRYLQEKYRARVNAFEGALICLVSCIGSLIVGLLGEMMDYRIVISVMALLGIVTCVLTIWRGREDIRPIYEK